ncbi:ROK family protein [Porcincola intestinalis]|uniref:ROK family protein n=1 Tax=Porcincola intestinalis TaxID=2606632 RepID=UPI0023F4A289|nr:ROK family protein [Porcincola intestinalis]MCI6766745.1 ROK family protein [Lachnospiraceae bacterium]MDD7059621.1 ROK family protein [Porcincola intestinalis]MDY5283620.1 ROK family protein [Porcincola intestinalis]
MDRFITIDIGGTDIKYGLMEGKTARFLEKGKRPTEAWLGGTGIVEKVLEIISSFTSGGEKADGVCISSAGMVDTGRGRIFYSGPNIPDYAGTEFKTIIEEKTGLPCEIENDVNCAGLSEAVLGAARGRDSVLCLTVGTGIGGCFVWKGDVYHGHSGSGCEIGYMNLEGGQFERLGAMSVLLRRIAEQKLQEKTDRDTAGGDKADGHAAGGDTTALDDVSRIWTGQHIFEAAREGDPICVSEIDRMCDILGKGIANICYVLNPEVVVLGGGVMAQKEYLYPRIRSALDRYLIPSIAQETELTMARQGNDAGMIGAYLHFQKMQRKRQGR